MIKRILLAVGAMPFSQASVDHALALAVQHQAQVTAVPLLDSDWWKASFRSSFSAGAAFDEAQRQPWLIARQRAKEVEALVARECADAGVPCEISLPQGDPMEWLIDLWRYHDLAIFGLRGLYDVGVVPEPEYAIAELIGRGIRPILAVTRNYRPVKRVLVAYSGSIESAKAMKRFVQMHLWQEPRVEVACFDDDADKAQKLLADASEYFHAHGLKPTMRHIDGSPATHLLPYATKIEADMIVVGSSYRHVLLAGVLGDTMLEICRHSTIPLFLSH